jgi:hypothetical protein
MTWTVQAGDVAAYGFSLVGHTQIVNIFLNSTTVGGTLDATLFVRVPGSATVAKAAMNTCHLIDNNVENIGNVYVASGGTTISINRVPYANFSASTDLTRVRCQITFEVQ